ncbi:MAG: hypothetical protein AB8H80_01665 [Planctomycetota bacterium]
MFVSPRTGLARLLFACSLIAFGSACVPVGVSGQVGYSFVQIDGDLALDDGGGGSEQSVEQGIESGFGLGDMQGSPYFRGQLDAGGPVLTGSVFWLQDNGEGQLQETFGGLPQNTSVAGELELAVGKLSLAYDIDFGLVKIAPGVMLDAFSLDFSARELALGSREEIDEFLFVPLPFVRAEAGLGPVVVVGELGYLDIDSLGDTSGRFIDFEASVEWSLAPLAHIFAGYRLIGIDGEGVTDSESFAADLQVSGWTIGGGIRF